MSDVFVILGNRKSLVKQVRPCSEVGSTIRRAEGSAKAEARHPSGEYSRHNFAVRYADSLCKFVPIDKPFGPFTIHALQIVAEPA